MAALVCDLCGGKLTMGVGGIATCDSCGMEHSPDRMQEKVQEIKGIVQTDSSHLVTNYLDMAINAIGAGNNGEAESYCNKIIEVDPTNYKAWMIKGEAAAWQSSLANPRINEGINAFAKGVNYAPEDEKNNVVEQAKEQIKNLCVAMIKLQTERFAKWPDEDETSGLISMLTNILSTVVNFLSQTGALVPLEEIMKPVAALINQSVVQSYENVIYPEYKSEKYPYPDDDDFRKFLNRIGYCITLIEQAIALCDTDDEDNIQRYENLIFLEEQAISSCSYKSEYFGVYNISDSQFESVVRRNGGIPDAKNRRAWYVNYSLNNQAKSLRRSNISKYKDKIKEIKAAKAAEKSERERIAREEAQKRFDDYWTEHAEEKASLEAEQKNLNSQIAALNASVNDQVAAFNEEIATIPGKSEIDNIEERIKKLTEEKSALGLFKGKEKKVIQEQIDRANIEKKSIQNRMAAAKKEIESKISSVKADIQKKISPLQNRVNTISNELTKAR